MQFSPNIDIDPDLEVKRWNKSRVWPWRRYELLFLLVGGDAYSHDEEALMDSVTKPPDLCPVIMARNGYRG